MENNNNNNNNNDDDDEMMKVMIDMMKSLQQDSMDDLELEQARTDDGQFFSLINLIMSRGLEQFVFCTKNNHSVKTVSLDIGRQRIYGDDGGSGGGGQQQEQVVIDEGEYYRRWERLAQGLGHLKGLKELKVNSRELLEDPENVPDYRALARVLRGVPQLEKLIFSCSVVAEDNGEDGGGGGDTTSGGGITEIATALHRHPSLLQIQFEQRTDVQALDTIARELITIPNLETVEFGFLTIARREIPTSLLHCMDSLKELRLHKCLLTDNQCEIMANQFVRGNILDLQHSRIEGIARLLRGLQQHDTIRNLRLSLSTLKNQQQQACDALASLVATSTSLENLTLAGRSFIDGNDDDDDEVVFDSDCLRPMLDALLVVESPTTTTTTMTTTTSCSLKSLLVGGFDTWSCNLTDRFRAALESNYCSLEELTVNSHDMAPNWFRLMPSLGSNKSLRKLGIGGGLNRLGAIALASNLSNNKKLEELSIIVIHDDYSENDDTSPPLHVARRVGTSLHHQALDEAEEEEDNQYTLARCVEALHPNITIKRLDVRFPHRWEERDVTPRGTQELEAAFLRNYSLEEVTGRYDRGCSIIPTLCQLNRAGRKYLVEDHQNRVRGIHVLSQVCTNLNALYHHLLENPALCCKGAITLRTTTPTATSSPRPTNVGMTRPLPQKSLTPPKRRRIMGSV